MQNIFWDKSTKLHSISQMLTVYDRKHLNEYVLLEACL